MDPQVFYQVVTPLIGVDNTAVLAISTPDDEFNYYSELLELNDENGNPLFHCIKVGLQCQACIEANKVCIHLLRKLPPWKSEGRAARVDAIMSANKEQNMRENRGVVISSRRYAFQSEWIKAFRERPRHPFTAPVKVLHMAIDPSGGGSMSDYAIVTCAREQGRVIVSIQHRNTYHDEI